MSALTSITIDAPYTFIVSNSPLENNGVITLAFDPSAPLLPANGGTGLTTVGTAGQFIVSNGTTLEWQTVPTGQVETVTASAPLLSSGGSSPNISISAVTGTGAVVLQQSPTLFAPIITTSMDLQGPLNGALPGAFITPGVYAGLAAGTNYAAIEMVSDANFKFIDMTRIGVDSDCRIIYDTAASQFTIFVGGGGPGAGGGTQAFTANPTATTIAGTVIDLAAPVIFQGSLGPNQAVFTDGNNRLTTIAGTGTGAAVRDNNATLFNARFVGNTFESIHFAWYAGNSTFPSGGEQNYKPATLFDSQGFVLAYDGGTGVVSNNTGATIFVTVCYHCKLSGVNLGATSYGVKLNELQEMGLNSVLGSDWATGTSQFKMGIGSTFKVFGTQLSGSGGDFDAASGFTYSYVFY